MIAAKATCFKIAASEEFRAYQRQVRANADALAETLLAGGIDLLTGGTDTHLLQLDLRATEWSGKDAEERLHAVGLTTNRNTVPFDERPPTVASGVRLGSQAATIRGFDEEDFREVGRIVVEALGADADVDALRARSEALCARRPLYPGFQGYTTYVGEAERRDRDRDVAGGTVTEVTHPLVQHKLGLLRDVTTTTQMFRQLVNELTLLLTYEATKGLADEEVEIETPLERTAARRISGKKVAVCPILRAGVGMLDAVLSLVPGARVGFIGLYRNEETLQPVEYYVKLPDDLADRDVILLDPMLATGNSTAAAVETVKRAGATSVRLIALIAAPEGIERIHRDHPDVSIVVASIDRQLNEKGYIVPGPRRRRRPPVRNEVAAMWSDLRANPEVVWGALIAFAIVVLLTPAVGGMARLLGVVDRPGGRRLNKRPIPRLGGLAIFLGILVPSLAFLSLDGEMRGIVLGAAVACVVGAVDDFRGLDPLPKLAGQIAAASIPLAFGVWIDHFTFPFLGVVDLSPWVGMPLTVVWIVAVMNMVNFLDGMDGLAAGVCAIAGLTFAILALSLGKVDAALLSAVVAGACIGFLRHNFFPARIFMGDSGALVLGFTLATVSISGLLKTASTVVLFLPLLVLAVPIIDTSFVVAKRVKYRQPISSPDRSHLHHRFMNIGFSQRRAALTMWAWTACLGAAALATRFIPFREGGEWHLWETIAVVAIALGALAFSVYIVYLLEIVKLANPRVRRRRAESEDTERLSA